MKSRYIYFVAGSQALYGDETITKVEQNAKKIGEYFNNHKDNPTTIKVSPVVKDKNEILEVIKYANNDDQCVGIIVWMHTFSPSKMWIEGYSNLNKPILHLHTQANQSIPFSEIDMDFMNLNQSAHGDREAGYMMTRMHVKRKVVAGYYEDPKVTEQVFIWARAALAYAFSRNLRIVRFGDNMKEVAVTDGDKVEAQIKLGWSVNGYGIQDLVEYIDKVDDQEVESLYKEHEALYKIVSKDITAIKEQVKQEIGLTRFLRKHQAHALTTSFEVLHGMKQLPGLSVQRLMYQGYGFGAEGDWKTAGLTAVIKYMASGLPGGTSFMEEYTYNLDKENPFVLGSHMLEICPSLADSEIEIDVHPLFVGGKESPARMKFSNNEGKGIVVTLTDLGDRIRMICNKVNLVKGPNMPKLPVAQILWKPEPSLVTSATAWIYAGGGHHSVLSTQVNENHLRDFARIAGIEFVLIDNEVDLDKFEHLLELSNVSWKFKNI